MFFFELAGGLVAVHSNLTGRFGTEFDAIVNSPGF